MLRSVTQLPVKPGIRLRPFLAFIFFNETKLAAAAEISEHGNLQMSCLFVASVLSESNYRSISRIIDKSATNRRLIRSVTEKSGVLNEWEVWRTAVMVAGTNSPRSFSSFLFCTFLWLFSNRIMRMQVCYTPAPVRKHRKRSLLSDMHEVI